MQCNVMPKTLALATRSLSKTETKEAPVLSSLRSSVLTLGLALFALPANAFDTTARAAYVIDQTTGTVLLSKEADQPLPPASMSKLMTLYVAFEALRRNA